MPSLAIAVRVLTTGPKRPVRVQATARAQATAAGGAMAEDGRISVCVVGAGPAGLCAARQLAAHPSAFRFDVFEQGAQLGGTWVYTRRTGIDENGLPIHSSMYESLRTNFLQELMAFPDFPFPEAEETSYPSHKVVLKYLQDYAAHFNLSQYIQFHTVAKVVKPYSTHAGNAWSVLLYNVKSKSEETKIYDAVMLCTGYNSVPDIPKIPGIECFRGHAMHCHNYRNSELYKGLTVAILGASFSGKDLSLEIATVAKEVYLCHNLKPICYQLPNNVHEAASIKEAEADGFRLNDDSFIKVDALLYCTGYKYDFQILSTDCGISLMGKRVIHLFKHMINIEYPTMALVGIPFINIPLPCFYYQIAYFLKTLKQPSVLPTKQEMLESEEEDFQERLILGFPPRHAHKMGHLQWDYNNSLADMAGIPRLPPVYKELCDISSERMKEAFPTFRNDNYAVLFKEKLELTKDKITFDITNLQL